MNQNVVGFNKMQNYNVIGGNLNKNKKNNINYNQIQNNINNHNILLNNVNNMLNKPFNQMQNNPVMMNQNNSKNNNLEKKLKYNNNMQMNNMNLNVNNMNMNNNMNNNKFFNHNNYMNNNIQMNMNNNMSYNNNINRNNNKIFNYMNNNNQNNIGNNNIMNVNMNNYMSNNINSHRNNMNFNNNNVNNMNNNNFNNMNNLGMNNNNNIGLIQQINYDFLNKNNPNNIMPQNLSQNNNNNFQVNQNNDNLMNFQNELELILQKLEQIFNEEELSQLKSEEKILNFFSQKEKECQNYVNESFGGNELLMNFMITQMEEIFKSNSIISDITEVTYFKLKDIPIEKIESEEEYYEKLNLLFGNCMFPDFLIEKDLKNIRCIQFYTNRKTETTLIINNARKRKLTGSQKLINYYEGMRDKHINVLDGINNKYEILYLFITINNHVFHKIYCGQYFFSFLEPNESLIKQYFDKNITYNGIIDHFRSMNTDKQNEQSDYLFEIIGDDIYNNTDKIYNIIASFYYLLFYEFKDLKLYKDKSNIGNVYINLILKNFVIYLDQKLRTHIKQNLYELLKNLYLSDINYLISQNLYRKKNKNYSFFEIDYLLLNDDNIKQYYQNLKDVFVAKNKIENEFGEGRDLTTFEKYIKLITVDKDVYSNTITILINGFTSEEEDNTDSWRTFMNYFQKETMIYFYKWPSDSKNNIFKKGILNVIRNGSKNFAQSSNRAKISGKLLAYILVSSNIFKDFQINLVGFSLGNHVIKHCLKELYKISNYNIFGKLKNVILIAAATHIANINLWKKYIQQLVIDRFINCYSHDDYILSKLYKGCMLKSAVGNDILEINDEQNNNLVKNYKFDYGHLSYDFGVVAKKVFSYYKDI